MRDSEPLEKLISVITPFQIHLGRWNFGEVDVVDSLFHMNLWINFLKYFPLPSISSHNLSERTFLDKSKIQKKKFLLRIHMESLLTNFYRFSSIYINQKIMYLSIAYKWPGMKKYEERPPPTLLLGWDELFLIYILWTVIQARGTGKVRIQILLTRFVLLRKVWRRGSTVDSSLRI